MTFDFSPLDLPEVEDRPHQWSECLALADQVCNGNVLANIRRMLLAHFTASVGEGVDREGVPKTAGCRTAPA